MKRRHCLSILFLALFICPVLMSAQDGKINVDSLKHQLSTMKEDTAKAAVLRTLIAHYTWHYPDTALFYAQQQLTLTRKLGDETWKARAYVTNGAVLSVMGLFPQAMPHFMEALKIAEAQKNERMFGFIYQNLAMSYRDQGDFGQARLYAYRFHALAEKIRDDRRKLTAMVHLGSIYDKFNVPDSALICVTTAHQLEEKLFGTHQWAVIPYLFGNIAAKKSNFQQAIEYYHTALPLARNKDLMDIHTGLARVYLQMGELDSSLYYAEKNIRMNNRTANPLAFIETGNLLARLYKTRQQKDSVIRYMDLVSAARDSLFSRDKIVQVQAITFNEQTRQQEVEAAKAAYRSRLQLYAVLGSLVVLAVITALLWRNNRQKHKANAALEQQKREIEYQRTKAEEALVELKAAQQQLVQAEKMASLGELTAGIAHEIQNPLNFVNNFSEVNKELLEELREAVDKNDSESVRELVADIGNNLGKISYHGQRADAIVKNMLQHSRKNTGEKELTDINALADEYLRLSYHGLRARDKKFNAGIATNFDESLDKVAVISQDIGRVLLNLFNNAFYAVLEKKKNLNGLYEPMVSVSTLNKGDTVEIVIKDNGTGVPQQAQDKIFQPFFTTKPTGSGTGLGLSLSYDIVRKGHNGELLMETVEGEYTAFKIILPAQSNEVNFKTENP